MSNIIEGDSVKNFGEFIPNPYIEKVTVEETGTDDLIKLTIDYSLLFLVGDQFDISDVTELFYENTINVYGMLEAKTTNSPSTREDLITDIYDGNILTNNGSAPIIRTNSQLGFIKVFGSEALASALFDEILQTDSDLYDSEDRQILKIYCSIEVEIYTYFTDGYLYLYLFCSTLENETITNAGTLNRSLLSLNIGDITYEKIFSLDLEIISDEQNVYAQSDGSKFGFTPLLSTDRNFYSTNTVTREMVIDKTQTLVNRFKNGEGGTLTDMVNSIEFVLQTQGQTEDLIPELDKVRKSFPNKTNNNPVGNLYASLSQLLININSAFPQTDKLERQKYTTGKVVDGRTAIDPELLTLPEEPSDKSYFIEPLITRLATEEGAVNDGAVFLNFEEMVKTKSDLFINYVDVDRFYEVCDEYSLFGLKRALFSEMQQQSFDISVSYVNLDGTEGESAGDVDLTQVNYSFQEPNNLMIAYVFRHTDNNSNSFVILKYKITAEFVDSTRTLLSKLLEKFGEALENLEEYRSQAGSVYSYNLKTQNFNSFFRDTAKAYWETNDYVYPWQLAPTIYGIIAYLTTDRFDSLDNLRTYTKNIIFNISPETGNLEHLIDFIQTLNTFKANITNKFDSSIASIITETFDDSIALTTLGLVSDTDESESSSSDSSSSSGVTDGERDSSYFGFSFGKTKPSSGSEEMKKTVD